MTFYKHAKSKLRSGTPGKTLLVLKLSLLFLISGMLQVSAAGYAQQITLSEKNAPLEQVFVKIKKQSGYNFLYNTQMIREAKPVSVQLKNVPMAEALASCFAGQPLTYVIENRTIIVKRHHQVARPKPPVSVSGHVRDENGGPLPGVTVKVKGENIGTTTDMNGAYSLNLSDGNSVLVFSFIGYADQEIAVNNRSILDVKLLPSAKSLEEVVVVGYGNQKRSELIGSVAQIGAKEVNNRTTPQLQQALTGQLAGVTVIQRSGQPGAPGGSIQIRGVGSFGAGTAPLIIVDGIPVGAMNDIDPNDVESVSVLKDASSAAIYGSRAANGVILITTKSAKSENLKVTYNGNFGIQKPTAYPEFVEAWEYATLLNEANGGGAGGYTEEEIRKFRDGSDPDNYPNIDYIDEVLKNQALQTGHNFTIANKSKNTDFLLSLGYLYQNGIIERNNFNRYNLRLNVGTQLASNIKLTTRLSGIQTIDKQPNGPPGISNSGGLMMGIISQAVRNPAIYPARLSNGDFGVGPGGTGTPISYLAAGGFFKNRTTDLNGNLRLDWEVVPGLKLSGIAGYTQGEGRNDRFFPSQRLNDNLTLGPSALDVNNVFNHYKTLQQLAEYGKTLGKHSLTLLAGHSYEVFYSENVRASRQDFPNNDITVIDAGSADNQTTAGSAGEYGLDSYFGRLKYSFANKYLAEGVIRHDGSSRFGPSNKYATFPSGAIGWRVSEEDFLKDKFSFLTDLKLKASYGVIGNQDIGNYPYQEILASGYNYGFGNKVNSGVANTTLVDPTIQWESTRTYDVGLDASLFNGKLSFSATHYNRHTYDILVSPGGSISDVLGFSVGEKNSGSLENKGWEFTADHRNQVGSVNYFVNANFSTLANKVLDLGVANIVQPNGLVGNGSSLFIGYPMGLYYGYLTDGLYVDQADVENYEKTNDQQALNPDPQPGDIKYRDISGPDGVPDGKVDATYDRTRIGSNLPRYSFGLNLGADYKGFSLSALLQGVAGVQARLNDGLGFAFASNGNVQRWMMEERWTQANPNPNALYPRIEQMTNLGTNNTLASDYWMLNAAYVKLRNVQLGYTLPAPAVERLGLGSLRFNINAENLLTISEFRKGWDPETLGGYNGYYPIMANFTFGVTAQF